MKTSSCTASLHMSEFLKERARFKEIIWGHVGFGGFLRTDLKGIVIGIKTSRLRIVSGHSEKLVCRA